MNIYNPARSLILLFVLCLLCHHAGAQGTAPTPIATPNAANAHTVGLAPYSDTWTIAQQRWWDISSYHLNSDFYNQFNAWSPTYNSAAQEYQSSIFQYNSQQLTVTYDSAPSVPYFVGHVEAHGLKPNFAYQLKLVGKPVYGPRGCGPSTKKTSGGAIAVVADGGGDDWANEQLGHIGRWWNDSNASGNTNAITDSVYASTYPTDTIYGYIFMGDFITDGAGNASVDFTGQNNYHITFQDWQSGGDIQIVQHGTPAQTVDTSRTDPATGYYMRYFPIAGSAVTGGYYGYGSTAPSSGASQENGYNNVYLWYQYESSMTAGRPRQVVLPPGRYSCRLLVTEESFHNNYGATSNDLGGRWKTVLATEDFAKDANGNTIYDSNGNAMPNPNFANDIVFNIPGPNGPVAPPDAPANLVATPGNMAANLSWSAVANATYYNIKRATVAAGPYTKIAGGVDTKTTSYTDNTAQNGTTYFYTVAAVNSGVPGADSAPAYVTPQVPAPPANDNFGAAQTISGAAGTATGANYYATKETGEPNHAGNAGGHSVWYAWTAPNNGTVSFDTSGSNFDTLLAVYAGAAVDNLTLVTSNDNASGAVTTSQLSSAVTAGTTYSIAVDGKGGATGNITLHWSLAVTPTPTTLSLNIAPATFSEAAGTNAATGTLTLDVATPSPLTVDLSSSDTNAVTVPPAVLIAAGSRSATFGLTSINDAIAEGPRTVTISAAAGSLASSQFVTVTDDETPTLGLTLSSNSIVLGGTFTVTLTRNTPVAAALQVNLQSSNTDKIAVPAAVMIPAGQSSLTFNVTALDKNVVDGNQNVTLTVSAPGFAVGSASITVINNNSPGIGYVTSANLTTTKAGGQATFTVALTSQPTANVTLNLTSSNTDEGTVSPATLTFTPANWDTARKVTITGVDNGLAEGNQKYTILITLTTDDPFYKSLQPAPIAITNVDTHQPTLTLSLSATTFSETAGLNAAMGTVTRNTPTNEALMVSLASSNPNAVTVPATVTIPAGAASTTFAVGAVDDHVMDGSHPATITASALGFNAGTATVTVTDSDPAPTFNLSGHVKVGTAGLSGAMVQAFLGSALQGTATTDASGSYQFNGLGVGTYTINVTKANYAFTPATATVTLGSNLANADFNAMPQFSLEGHLTQSVKGKTQPLAGVLVFARSQDVILAARTNSKGEYLFNGANLMAGTYFIAPGVTGTYFAPRSRSASLTALVPVSSNLNFSVAGKDAIKPVVKVMAPLMSQTLTSLTSIKGTATDKGAGVGFITIAIAHYGSAVAPNASSYWNWKSKIWQRSDNAANVEKLATGTVKWTFTSLPKLPPGFYGVRATAIDNAANSTRSAWVRFSVNRVGKVEIAPAPSTIKLSTAIVIATTDSAQLKFVGALDAEAASDAAHYAVTVNGQAVAVESAGYNATRHAVTLDLVEGSVKVGDHVVIQYDLQDNDGLMLAGQVGLTVAR